MDEQIRKFSFGEEEHAGPSELGAELDVSVVSALRRAQAQLDTQAAAGGATHRRRHRDGIAKKKIIKHGN